ncbi:MAG: T9SS type A sorting domain-containing protein [Taibaiella sp.]|nr:T9SS type A sorting domain-containing protein [Taibaiella sp.]
MKRTFYKIAASCISIVALAGSVKAQTIYTFCGSTAGYSGDGGPASAARIALPGAIKYHNGYIYVVDANNELIRKIDATSPFNITSIAGSQSIGYSGDGGPATAAETYLGGVGGGIVADNAGNVYFTDIYNNCIRKVNSSGTISTFAGGGSGGDGGPATAASLNRPFGLAIDGTGDLYVCEEQGHKIRKIAAATGVISTIAGTGTAGYTGDGGPATAADISYPDGIALDASGNVYFTDYDNSVIRKITVSTGAISTYATGFNKPAFMEFDQAGNLFVGNFQSDGMVCRVKPSGVVDTVAGTGLTSLPSGDGGPATAAGLGSPRGVTITPNGNLLISCRSNSRIRVVIAATATITGTASLCTGATTTLTASIPGAAWISSNAGIATVSSTGVVTGVAAGTATITYVAGLVFGTQVVTVNAPVAPAISAAGASLSVPATYATYQWSLGGTPIPGATSATYEATATGTYAVAVTDAGGCSVTSANFILSSVSVSAVTKAAGLLIAPNPTQDGKFTISLPTINSEAMTIIVTNAVGEKVYETKSMTNTRVSIELNVPAGMYIVQAKTAEAKYTAKVIIN